MPVVKRGATQPAEWPELVEELAAELQKGPKSKPVIIEEQVRGMPRFHSTVIWQKWRDVPSDDRASVILDAYERAFGPMRMLQVSLALGLTPQEAKRLGVK